ncbi:MAG: methylated-DNA--[protein]-cysteine S-methyltransferase [Mariprofundaceae bacterium]
MEPTVSHKHMEYAPRLFSYQSPGGSITLRLCSGQCHEVRLEGSDAPPCPKNHPVAQWLDRYFAGLDTPVLPVLGRARTPFQHRLRHALLDIPLGEVRTYGEVARELTSGPRAVGQALGANPLPILIPCHRVVAADGLGGFACGQRWKKILLQLEGVISPENPWTAARFHQIRSR